MFANKTTLDIHKEIQEKPRNLGKVVGILRIKGNEHFAKQKDLDGRLPIHSAIYHGRVGVLDLVKELVRIFPECVKEKSNISMLPLHCLKWSRLKYAEDSEEFFKVAKYLLALYPEALNERDIHGELPLRCRHKSVKLVRHLIEEYPNWIKTQDKVGNLPLHIHCELKNADATYDIIKLCLDAYPEGILVKNAYDKAPLDEIVNSDFDSFQSDSKIFLALVEAYKRIKGTFPSADDHPISGFQERIPKLPKKHLRKVKFLLKHYDCTTQEHNKHLAKIQQLEEELGNTKQNADINERVQLKEEIQSMTRELQSEKDANYVYIARNNRLLDEITNLKQQIEQNTGSMNPSGAELSLQLDAEKKRAVDLAKKLENMKACVVQARKRESELLINVLESTEPEWPLDSLYKLTTNMHTRLSNTRDRVVPQGAAPSSAQLFFELIQDSYASNGRVPDRKFLVQAIRDINKELLDLEKKYGFFFLSVDDDVASGETSRVPLGTTSTRPLEQGRSENDSPPKRARIVSYSANISPE